MSKRDSSVEILRIAGCFFVLALHCSLPVDFSEPGMKTAVRGILYAAFSLGVPVFFMITGFFLFSDGNILKRYRKFGLSVLIPAAAVMLLSFILRDWIIGARSLLSCILHPFADPFLPGIKNAILAALNLRLRSMPDCVAHLWYIKDYFKCLLIYPLLYYALNHEKAPRFLPVFFLILCAADLLMADLSVLCPDVTRGIFFYNPLLLAVCYMLAGYVVYRERERIRRHRVLSLLFGLCLFFAGIAGKYLLQLLALNRTGDTQFFEGWENLISMAASFGLVTAVLSFPSGGSGKGRLISFLGKRTFTVYLIHLIFVQKAQTRGVKALFESFCHTETAAGSLLFSILYPLLMLILCMMVSTALYALKMLLTGAKNSFQKAEKVKKNNRRNPK